MPGGDGDDHTVAVARRRHGRGAVFALAGTALVALGLFAAMAAAVLRPKAGPTVGQPAPAFRLQTFDGDVLDLADLAGDVVVLNFWASWCVPCADEADDLEALWRRFRDRGVRFVGVNFVDTDGPARAYLATHGVTYPNGPDLGGRISASYRVTGVPETFVVDRGGRIVSLAAPGAPPADRLKAPLTLTAPFTPDHLADLIDRLLADGGPTGARPDAPGDHVAVRAAAGAIAGGRP